MDVSLNSVCNGFNDPLDSVVCFNKMYDVFINYDIEKQHASVDFIYSDVKTTACNSYTYKYMGLPLFVKKSRQLYTRQCKWREQKYKFCSNTDINMISNELLSLPETSLVKMQ